MSVEVMRRNPETGQFEPTSARDVADNYLRDQYDAIVMRMWHFNETPEKAVAEVLQLDATDRRNIGADQ